MAIKINGISHTGTSSNDKLIGTAENDRIVGLAGNDSLIGNAGDDLLDGGVGNDSLDGGNGNDELSGGDGNDALVAGSGNDKLDGGKGNDRLDSGSSNDTLQGGLGADSMSGSDGDDYYFVDSVNDSIIESEKNKIVGGNDTVETTLQTYTLGKNVENLILAGILNNDGTGNELNNTITGNVGDNKLNGGTGNDKLNSGAGADTLDGGKGMDTLIGGAGDDTYLMNNAEDSIVEEGDGGEQDQIIASVSFDLSVFYQVEILTLSGARAVNGMGNQLNNLLQEAEGGHVDNVFSGQAGDDTINGEGGNDTLNGGEGDDELNGGDGKDVAVFAGLYEDYRITLNTDAEGVAQLIIEYSNPNTDILDGKDILNDIEILEFADASQNVFDIMDIMGGISTSEVPTGIVDPTVTAPSAPTLNDVTGDNLITDQERISGVTIFGTGEVGSTTILNFQSSSFELFSAAHIVVDADGVWSYTLQPQDYLVGYGTELIRFSSLDAADNVSETVTTEITLIDTTQPPAPTFDVVAGDYVIDQTERDAGVVLRGTAEPESMVILTFADGSQGEAFIDAEGNWDYELTEDNYYTNDGDFLFIEATATDAAGNVSDVVALGIELATEPSEPTYILSVNKTMVNEGDTAVFKLETTHVEAGTEIPFEWSGTVSDADVTGSLPTNNFVVDANGKASLSVSFLADKFTEGAEDLTITLSSDGSQSTTVSVKDTSLTPAKTQHPHTGTVSIKGTAKQGETLSVTSTLKDVDNLGALKYQWLKNGSPIKGATKATYTLAESDVGKVIKVKVSYTDGLGKAETESSAATAVVKAKVKSPTYTLNVDKTTVSEGEDEVATATFTLKTTNVAANTEVAFKFGGTIKDADVLGGLPEQIFIVDESGIAIIPVSFNADDLTEGLEKLTVTLVDDNKKTATISVKDTSVASVIVQPDPVDETPDEPVVTPTPSKIKGFNKIATDPTGDKLIGDGGNDTLTGITGDDELIGDAGDDLLKGEFGNDTLDSGNGNDTLIGGDGNDNLWAGSDNDLLDGGNGSDTLIGDKGNDTLQGGLGNDKMDGGVGDDYYYVDSMNDTITEASKSGMDTVETALTYVLPANFENLKLIGSGNKNGTGNKEGNIITGNEDDNVLVGNDGNDKLVGGNGADDLDGSSGVDTLIGGEGDDIYRINNLLDTITEDRNGGASDQIIASVDYSLESSFVEVLILSGTAINGTGNDSDNLLQELAGGKIANVFNGKEGADTLEGGFGDDTLEGGDGNDIIDGGAGNDTVIFNGAKRDYQIKKNPDTSDVPQIKVKYVGNSTNGESDEGTDILTNIELIKFSSGEEANASDYIGTVSSSQRMQIEIIGMHTATIEN